MPPNSSCNAIIDHRNGWLAAKPQRVASDLLTKAPH
jgi:hypothetical protein